MDCGKNGLRGRRIN